MQRRSLGRPVLKDSHRPSVYQLHPQLLHQAPVCHARKVTLGRARHAPGLRREAAARIWPSELNLPTKNYCRVHERESQRSVTWCHLKTGYIREPWHNALISMWPECVDSCCEVADAVVRP